MHRNRTSPCCKQANGQKHQWQLLATGSLGSDLAQNAYRMFVGSTDDDITDGPHPSAPKTFTTWEEYYQYLQRTGHDGMSEEEKALMEIAKNNKGKIEEHEHHSKPITFGLSVTKSFGKIGIWKQACSILC